MVYALQAGIEVATGFSDVAQGRVTNFRLFNLAGVECVSLASISASQLKKNSSKALLVLFQKSSRLQTHEIRHLSLDVNPQEASIGVLRIYALSNTFLHFAAVIWILFVWLSLFCCMKILP